MKHNFEFATSRILLPALAAQKCNSEGRNESDGNFSSLWVSTTGLICEASLRAELCNENREHFECSLDDIVEFLFNTFQNQWLSDTLTYSRKAEKMKELLDVLASVSDLVTSLHHLLTCNVAPTPDSQPNPYRHNEDLTTLDLKGSRTPNASPTTLTILPC